MANPFLTTSHRDVETAIMLEQAIVHDIDNAVAYTDGDKIFINTDDNLFKILPAYDHNFLKWLLWHERYHKELRHHNRFFKYLEELEDEDCMDEFQVTKDEVNIIMDILVHDSLSKMFPELIEIATTNLAQMRDRNSLRYTFKTHTLEEMLEEYRKHKHPDEKDGEGEGEGEEGKEGKESDSKASKSKPKPDTPKEDTKDEPKGKSPDEDKKGHGEGGSPEPHGSDSKEDSEPEIPDAPEEKPEIEDHHDETDWSKLENIDSKEFISEDESYRYVEEINRLKRKKFRLGQITETLNGLATSTRRRTYASPSRIQVGKGVILKGTQPGKAKLYLCFDASGSMGRELETFKEIISKSIPQAMNVPCEWFTYNYGKGTFKDIMKVYADSGFSDDGDRLIELCWKAEQAGYSPIGVTDGGGGIYWNQEHLKQLQRTILVGQDRHWLEKAKQINPRVQILDI